MPAKTKKATFFKEKRDFISRMLNGSKPLNYSLDMVAAKKVFDQFDNDIDFLSKVKPPFKMNGSIKYFITAEGMKYLKKKYKEFNFKVPEHEIPLDLGEKAGEDIEVKKQITIRNFLS